MSNVAHSAERWLKHWGFYIKKYILDHDRRTDSQHPMVELPAPKELISHNFLLFFSQVCSIVQIFWEMSSPFLKKIFDRMIPRLSQGKNGGEIFSGCDEKTNLVLGALSAYNLCTTV